MVEHRALIHDGLGHTLGQSLGVFYADYGRIGYWEPGWMQGYMKVLVVLLQRIVLAANFSKSNTMTFRTVSNRSGMSQEEFGRRSTGGGYTP